MNVNFLINDEDLFAYFPDENYNEKLYGNTMKMSYAHLGQHSACHETYATASRNAERSAYKHLLAELQQIGYTNLKIIKR